MCRVPLLEVEIVGREKLDRKCSYVFVANHQGPYDIFLIYGYLGQDFRWLFWLYCLLCFYKKLFERA